MSITLTSRIVHLESLVKLHEEQLEQFSTETQKWSSKLNLIAEWISTKFGNTNA